MDLIQQPPIARDMKIRACQSCNRRKKKCNGQKPRCHLCIQAGTICTYPLYFKKPGPKTGSKRAQHNSVESRDARQSRESTRTAIDNQDGTLIGDETWPLFDPALQRPTTSSGSSTSKVSYAYHAKERRSESNESCVYSVLDQIKPLMSPHQSSLIDPVLPPQELINHLVDIYFDFVHPQLRLLHRPSFLPWIRSGAFVSDRDSTLLLSAMFALATRYSDQPEVDLFDRSLSNNAENDDGRRVSGCRRRKRCERGKGFLRQANRLFQSSIYDMEKLELESGRLPKPSIRFVQASALLSYAETGLAPSSRAYSLISAAVRLAYDCGLDRIDSYDTRTKNDTVDAGNLRSEIVRKEELRRAWWTISDMENFICTTKGRPRMIDWENCRTKLPCDDRDWFEGREGPSFFLPASLSDLSASWDLPSYISVMAYRILARHLVGKFMHLAVNENDPAETYGRLSIIQKCAAVWKLNAPSDVTTDPPFRQTVGEDEVLSDALPLRILIECVLPLISMIRTFKDATLSKIFLYCQDISIRHSDRDRPPENGIVRSPESQAFAEALRASDAICSIVRDWPTHSIARSSPFIAGALWVPACVQLLVKSFAGASLGIAEKASLSLRILTMAMEQFAEFWGLGHYLLDCFRKYEQKLINLDWSDEGQGEWLSAQTIPLPDYIDASFLKVLSPVCSPDAETELFSGAELEQHLDSMAAGDSTHMTAMPIPFLSDGTGSRDYVMEDLSWMGVEGADESNFM